MTSVTRDSPFYIVLNPRSGARDAGDERAIIAEVLAGAGRRHEFVDVDHPRRLSQAARRAADAALRHDGIVVAAGGDGTINAVVQAALSGRRPFGIIPQGTFNYSCRAHGIPLDTAEAVRALLDATIKPVQVGVVNGHAFLVNASVGIYPELLEEREAFKQRLGRRRSVAVIAGLVTLLREHRQLALEIAHDGRVESVVTPSLFVGNNALQLEQAGLPEAEALAHRRLAAVIVAPMGPRGLIRLALRGAFGTLAETDEVRSFDFRTLRVAPGRGIGRQRLKVAMDGEITYMRPPLEFTLATDPLYLLVPRSPDDSG